MAPDDLFVFSCVVLSSLVLSLCCRLALDVDGLIVEVSETPNRFVLDFGVIRRSPIVTTFFLFLAHSSGRTKQQHQGGRSSSKKNVTAKMSALQGDIRGTTNKELLNHFITTALGTKKGKILISSWVMILGTSVTVGILKTIRQRRWKRAERAVRDQLEKSPSLQHLQALSRDLDASLKQGDASSSSSSSAAASPPSSGPASASSSSSAVPLQSGKDARAARPIASRSLVDQLKFLFPIAFPSVFSRSTGHLFFYTFLLALRIVLTIKIAEVTGKLAKVRLLSLSL